MLHPLPIEPIPVGDLPTSFDGFDLRIPIRRTQVAAVEATASAVRDRVGQNVWESVFRAVFNAVGAALVEQLREHRGALADWFASFAPRPLRWIVRRAVEQAMADDRLDKIEATSLTAPLRPDLD